MAKIKGFCDKKRKKKEKIWSHIVSKPNIMTMRIQKWCKRDHKLLIL